MQKHIISTSDSNSMRGMAIVLIVLHNLIHIFHPLKENEFFYHPHNANGFITSLFSFSDTLWLDVMSFLGWYGITAFLFLSGYGLVRKYEVGQAEEGSSFFKFMGSQFKKMWLLMLLPYMCYLLINYLCFDVTTSAWQMVQHVGMVANFWPDSITPGVYWFFGLMIQLYLCYYLFIFKKSNLPLILLNVLSLAIMALCVYYNWRYPLLYGIRHQCLGWFLPFTLGIWYARYPVSIIFEAYWKNALMFLLGTILLIAASVNAYTWLFTPIISVALTLYGCELLKKLRYAHKAMVYVGSISALIYVIHPIVRMVFLGKIPHQTTFTIFAYFFLSILLAIAYQPLYKWVNHYFNKQAS